MNATSRSSLPRVSIIGAGVIGLGIGWSLAEAGAAVTVHERGVAGHGASWAAAGMLAAGVEAEPTEEALYRLGRYSQSLWPDFARRLEAASGLPSGYRESGTLVCAFTRDQATRLRHTLAFQARLGARLELLTAAAARALEPGLAPQLLGALFSPDDHQADNRLLGQALAAALTRAGGSLIEAADASVVVEDGRAVGVLSGGRLTEADLVLVAAGPWSRAVAGLPPAALPPVRPVKGQMLALQMDPAKPLVRHVVWGASCYLVPRDDGRLIVGATTEERGFDDRVTAGGVLALLDDAWRTVPGIEDCPLIERWAGFRPGSPDDMPILGPTPVAGLWLATGHHRNGILLTPATASLVAEAILSGHEDARLAPFSLARFGNDPP